MLSVVMLNVVTLNVVAPISPLAFLISNMFQKRWPTRVFMTPGGWEREIYLGENLNVARNKFSTLSWPVLLACPASTCHAQQTVLELKG
jgi:hypothetical protein